MTVLQSWGDSLSLFTYQNFKLFTLVTLKSIIDVYKKLLQYWWWLVIPALLIYSEIGSAPVLLMLFVGFFFTNLFIFAVICSTRPSIEQKNSDYFKQQLCYFPLTLAFLLPGYFLPKIISVAPIAFFILFYLDSVDQSLFKKAGVFKAWKRTILMGVYNMPLLIIINFILRIFYIIILSCVAVSPLAVVIISFLLLPISGCVYTNIYIKRLHEQFELYFPQPK
jgi:hypothetical protein